MRTKLLTIVAAFVIAIAFFLRFSFFSTPVNHGHVETKLFLADSDDQLLIVGFGGSEGGNVFASEQLKQERDKYLERGYAFLAVGYFGTSSTPSAIDRIALDAIHDSIINIVSKHPMINKRKVVLYGGSRGGELALNLASRYKDFNAVIAVVPSNVSLPTKIGWGARSSWTFFDKELPYISYTDNPDRPGEFFIDLNEMLKDKQAVTRAAIPVEQINGPILLLSARNDKVWPSTLMCEMMVERLKSKHFKYDVEHIILEGSHTDAANNLEYVLDFLQMHLATNKF